MNDNNINQENPTTIKKTENNNTNIAVSLQPKTPLTTQNVQQNTEINETSKAEEQQPQSSVNNDKDRIINDVEENNSLIKPDHNNFAVLLVVIIVIIVLGLTALIIFNSLS